MKRFIVSTFMLFNVVFCLFPKPAYAQMWGTSDIFGDLMMQMMDTIKRQIEGALIGTLKMAAIQMLNSKVGQLIGGVAGGKPLFITNFNEFLYQTPQQNTNLYMNDFFSMTTRGKGSSANYIVAGGSGTGVDYTAYLVESAKKATTESEVDTYNLDEYGGIDAFSSGNPRTFNALVSNPMNNRFGFDLAAREAYENELEKQREIARMKALSTGVLPAEKDGVIVAPSVAIGATLTNAADLPNKMIAAASNPGELLSGVVSAMANKLVSNLIQKGVGEVQSKISSAMSNVDNKISGAIGSQIQQLGPAAQYMNNVNQNINATVRTNTPAPPPAKGCAGSASGLGGC